LTSSLTILTNSSMAANWVARLRPSLTILINLSCSLTGAAAPRRKSSTATASTRYSPSGAVPASQWGLTFSISFFTMLPRRRPLAFGIADLTPHRDYVCFTRRYDSADVPAPRFERGASLFEVLKSIVDRCYAANRAAHMVEHF